MGAPVPISGPEAFQDPDRRLIAEVCRNAPQRLSTIAKAFDKHGGSIRGKVRHMADHRLLVEHPARRSGVGPAYLLSPARVADYEAARLAAANELEELGEIQNADQPGVFGKGERVVILGGDLPEVAAALKRLAIERHARWTARLDGPHARLLIALGDDGPRADEIEREIRGVRGTVTQARIDRFFDLDGLTRWLDSPAPDSDEEGPG